MPDEDKIFGGILLSIIIMMMIVIIISKDTNKSIVNVKDRKQRNIFAFLDITLLLGIMILPAA